MYPLSKSVSKNPLKCQSLFSTLPETNTASKNRSCHNELIFQPFIFRGELLVDIRLKQALILISFHQPFLHYDEHEKQHGNQNILTSSNLMSCSNIKCSFSMSMSFSHIINFSEYISNIYCLSCLKTDMKVWKMKLLFNSG